MHHSTTNVSQEYQLEQQLEKQLEQLTLPSQGELNETWKSHSSMFQETNSPTSTGTRSPNPLFERSTSSGDINQPTVNLPPSVVPAQQLPMNRKWSPASSQSGETETESGSQQPDALTKSFAKVALNDNCGFFDIVTNQQDYQPLEEPLFPRTSETPKNSTSVIADDFTYASNHLQTPRPVAVVPGLNFNNPKDEYFEQEDQDFQAPRRVQEQNQFNSTPSNRVIPTHTWVGSNGGESMQMRGAMHTNYVPQQQQQQYSRQHQPPNYGQQTSRYGGNASQQQFYPMQALQRMEPSPLNNHGVYGNSALPLAAPLQAPTYGRQSNFPPNAPVQAPPLDQYGNRQFETPQQKLANMIRSGVVPRPAMGHGYTLGANLYQQQPVSESLIYQVQFKGSIRHYTLGAQANPNTAVGDFVLVEADRGEDIGVVTDIMPMKTFIERRYLIRGTMDEEDCAIGRIARVASFAERQILPEKYHDEQRVVQFCRELALQTYRLPLIIVDAEYQFDRHKLTIYYHSEVRVDFREMVRDLFSAFKARIWMKKINMHSPTPLDQNAAMALASGMVMTNR